MQKLVCDICGKEVVLHGRKIPEFGHIILTNMRNCEVCRRCEKIYNKIYRKAMINAEKEFLKLRKRPDLLKEFEEAIKDDNNI